MITDDIENIVDLAKAEPKDKKAEVHRNLKIGFTVLGIIVFGMSAVINYYTLKKLTK
tara:strand:- start:298 stop:468 length:171 start_codon:yes stop_codon:yes gene_type:complete